MRLEQLMLRFLSDRENYHNPHGVAYALDGEDCCLLTCVHPGDRSGCVTLYLDSMAVSQLVRLFSLRTLQQFLSLTPARLQRVFAQQGPAQLFVCVEGTYDSLAFRWEEGQLIAYDLDARVGIGVYDAKRVESLIAYTERYFETIIVQKKKGKR
jgi:hypothetical protein